MREIARLFIRMFFIAASTGVCALFVGAQTAVNYRFLEVVDYAGSPVSGALVKTDDDCGEKPQKTNEKGQLEKGLTVYGGDCTTRGFRISKENYFPFEDLFGIVRYSREPLKIELLLIPKTPAERKAIGSEQQKREFFAAARKADAETVRKFLKTGLSANLTTSDLRGVPAEKDVPVIVFAAMSGDRQTLDEFLSAGVDVRKLPNILMTYLSASPFMRRSPANNAEIKEFRDSFEIGAENLVKAGANVKALDAWNSTTLMIAAEQRYFKTAKLLIDKGVSIDAKDNSGRTALMRSINSSDKTPEQIEMANLLLKSGANPNVVHNGGFYYAQQCQTALITAVFNGNLEMAKLLVANKANVNLTCENGDTALKYAKELQARGFSDFREIIKFLETAGAK